jgi:hypothetical protein
MCGIQLDARTPGCGCIGLRTAAFETRNETTGGRHGRPADAAHGRADRGIVRRHHSASAGAGVRLWLWSRRSRVRVPSLTLQRDPSPRAGLWIRTHGGRVLLNGQRNGAVPNTVPKTSARAPGFGGAASPLTRPDRGADNPKVAGSNPAPATGKLCSSFARSPPEVLQNSISVPSVMVRSRGSWK